MPLIFIAGRGERQTERKRERERERKTHKKWESALSLRYFWLWHSGSSCFILSTKSLVNDFPFCCLLLGCAIFDFYSSWAVYSVNPFLPAHVLWFTFLAHTLTHTHTLTYLFYVAQTIFRHNAVFMAKFPIALSATCVQQQQQQQDEHELCLEYFRTRLHLLHLLLSLSSSVSRRPTQVPKHVAPVPPHPPLAPLAICAVYIRYRHSHTLPSSPASLPASTAAAYCVWVQLSFSASLSVMKQMLLGPAA